MKEGVKMKKTKLHLRKEIKIILLIVSMIITCNWGASHGAMALESTWGAIKVILAWCSIPATFIGLTVINK